MEHHKNLRAVFCIRCREPIAVPTKVANLQDEQSDTAHAFTLRCKLCEHENIYSVMEVRIFPGEPRMRIRQARAAYA